MSGKSLMKHRCLKNFYSKDFCSNLNLEDIKDSENFRKMCLEIYQLDHAKFLSVPGSAW